MMDRRGQAIEAVYRARQANFRYALLGLTGSVEDAREAVQEGFARAFAARESYSGRGPLEAWIWRIVLNSAIEQSKRPATLPLEEIFALQIPATSDVDVVSAFRALPSRERLFAALFYLGDLDYRTIAELCEVSIGTVGAALAHARASLTQSLGDDARSATQRSEVHGDKRAHG